MVWWITKGESGKIVVATAIRRVSKAVRLLRQKGAVKGRKDAAGRWVWGTWD